MANRSRCDSVAAQPLMSAGASCDGCMSRQLLPASPDERDTARFLRRFSELISIGQNASYLRHAAGLIEELVERVRRAESHLHDQMVEAAKAAILREAAEQELRSARRELDRRDQLLADERARRMRSEASSAAERGSLVSRLAIAEARLADASRALLAFETGPRDSEVVVTIETLASLRAQFEAVAEASISSGDTVTAVMCEAGVCTLNRALAGGR
jgi:hypothetical protein